MVGVTAQGDNYVHRMAVEDPVPWYRKRNLRYLYFMLFPCLMGIEMTSGFDSQIINAVQLVPAWDSCKSSSTPIGLVHVQEADLACQKTSDILPGVTKES